MRENARKHVVEKFGIEVVLCYLARFNKILNLNLKWAQDIE